MRKEKITHPTVSGLDRILEKNRYFILVSLAVVVFIKTIVTSAAYPIFSPIDEPEHYDVISKYARGHIPQKDDLFDPDVYLLTLIKSTKEYIVTEDELKRDTRDYFGSVEDAPAELKVQILRKIHFKSGEGGQPPVYYFLLGTVKNFVEKIGFRDENVVYALRFFNGVILSMLICMAFFFVKAYLPNDMTLMLGTPLMITLLPQDAFFQIGNDVLSPLVFLIACYFLFKVIFNQKVKFYVFIIAGLFTALAFLTKHSNIPIYLIMSIAIFARLKYIRDDGARTRGISGIALLALIGVAPSFLWVIRNYAVFGDFSGFGQRIAMLGWTRKTFGSWFAHPMFCPNGLFVFLRDLTVKFWRGEYFWHARPIFSTIADNFYFFSTVLFLASAIVNLFRERDRRLDVLLLLILVTFILQLAYLSIAFDFGSCYYPSSAYPYFTSGRLILGVLVPFLILYLKGYQFLVRKVRIGKIIHPFILLVIVMVAINVIEIKVNLPAFSSARNWFFYNFTIGKL